MSSKSIEISRRSERDRPELEDLYNKIFGAKAAEENRKRWSWQYEDNPNCPVAGPEIWVAKENGLIVGQYATMPIRLKVLDRTIAGSWGMDVMVDPSTQRKGIGSRLWLYWDRQVEASLGLGLSVSSYTLFKKLNWNDVGPVTCFSAVVDPRALLERYVGGSLARLLAPLAELLRELVLPRRRTKGGDRVSVDELSDSFGKEYDLLWENVAPEFDFVAERKARYLQWKFLNVPYINYDIYEARRDEILSGYIILRRTVRNNVPLALIVDILAHPSDHASFGKLLDKAYDWARKRGCARLQTFTLDRRIGARLASKGFYRIPSPMQFCVRIHSDHISESFFCDTSRWHVSFGDSDQDRDL